MLMITIIPIPYYITADDVFILKPSDETGKIKKIAYRIEECKYIILKINICL